MNIATNLDQLIRVNRLIDTTDKPTELTAYVLARIDTTEARKGFIATGKVIVVGGTTSPFTIAHDGEKYTILNFNKERSLSNTRLGEVTFEEKVESLNLDAGKYLIAVVSKGMRFYLSGKANEYMATTLAKNTKLAVGGDVLSGDDIVYDLGDNKTSSEDVVLPAYNDEVSELDGLKVQLAKQVFHRLKKEKFEVTLCDVNTMRNETIEVDDALAEVLQQTITANNTKDGELIKRITIAQDKEIGLTISAMRDILIMYYAHRLKAFSRVETLLNATSSIQLV